jgi:hypothetical protein
MDFSKTDTGASLHGQEGGLPLLVFGVPPVSLDFSREVLECQRCGWRLIRADSDAPHFIDWLNHNYSAAPNYIGLNAETYRFKLAEIVQLHKQERHDLK